MVIFLDLDHIPFDGADGFGGGEDGGEVDGPAADFFFVFEVEELDAATLFADESGGVFAADVDPINVGLAGEVARGGGVEEPVEAGAAVEQGEFERVVVVMELEAEAAEGGAEGIEFGADGGGGGGGVEEGAFEVGANDVAGAEEKGLGGDFAEVCAEGLDAHVHARAGEAGVADGLGSGGGVEVAEAGGFDAGVTDFGDFGDSSGEVGFDEIAERVELEGEGGFWHGG